MGFQSKAYQSLRQKDRPRAIAQAQRNIDCVILGT